MSWGMKTPRGQEPTGQGRWTDTARQAVSPNMKKVRHYDGPENGRASPTRQLGAPNSGMQAFGYIRR
jgi:hypothetical protein